MKYLRRTLAALAVSVALRAGEPTSYDVVVYGGTPAGLVAAIAAAREGRRVIVLEPSRWIGGMVTGGLSSTDTGREATIGGITREFFMRAAAAKPGTPLWRAEPGVNLATFNAMLAEAGVTCRTTALLQSARQADRRIQTILTTDGRSYDGRVFVDASYEGDLLAKAGVRSTVGRESREQYGEPLAGFQPMPLRPHEAEVMASTCPCVGGNGPHYIHGTPVRIAARDAAGGLLAGVNAVRTTPGSADPLVQSYNFRLCVTQQPELRVPFPKPARYAAARYELLRRLIQSYPRVRFARLVHLAKIANGKYDLNAQGLFSTDYAGGNVGYVEGDAATRARIWQDHRDYVQGFLWFLGHDERVPAALREETNAWGLCRDEFTDHDGWPYALYVRTARRMLGERVLTQHDLQQNITKPDTVAMGSFVIDCHIVQRIVTEDGFVTDEGSFADAPVRPYQIPYSSLVPRASECRNLLVPVCLSMSHVASCSIRMEPVYMALGHACGVAATQALKANCAVQEIDVAALQARLREQKQVLELPETTKGPASARFPGIVVDDGAADYTGTWIASGYGNPIDGASRHDGNAGRGTKSVRFSAKLPQPGNYEVRFAYVPAPNRAAAVRVTVVHAGGRSVVTVNQRETPAHDGLFVSLGTYRFAGDAPAVVEITNEGADGYVSVDAVQWLPARE